MEILRKLRFILYPSAFALVFLMAAYCSFPKNVLRDMAESSILHTAINVGPRSRGLPEVSFRDISLWRISGMRLDGLKVNWPPKKTEAPLIFEIDSFKGRAGIFSLLAGSKTFSANLKLYDGNFDASVGMRPKNSLGFLDAEGDKINLGKMSFVENILGAPLQGIVHLLLNLDAQTELNKDGTGLIKLTIDNCAYGPGVIKLPSGGMVSALTVPKVNLGKFNTELTLEKGQIETKTISLLGGDLEADYKVSVTLGRKPTSSRVSGEGWFSVKREFVNNNETLKMLYDLLPVLRTAHQGDGKVGLVIRGNLARPDISLEHYTGARADSAKNPVANNNEDRHEK